MSITRALNAFLNPTKAKAEFRSTGTPGTKVMAASKPVGSGAFTVKGVSVVRTLRQVQDLVRQRQLKEAESVLTRHLNRDLGVHWSPLVADGPITVSISWLSTLDPTEFKSFERLVRGLKSVIGSIHLVMSGSFSPGDVIAEIKDLGDAARQADLLITAHTDGIKHGRYVLILGRVPVSHLQEIVETVDHATKLTRRRFPEVCYGRILFREDIRGPEKGSYNAERDTIVLGLYQTEERNSVRTLIHEFGHRYEDKFLTKEQRTKFKELSYVGDVRIERFSHAERERMADRYLMLQDRHRQRAHGLTDKTVDVDAFIDPRMELWFHNQPRATWKEYVVPWLQRFRDDNDTSAEVVRKLRSGLGMLDMPGNYALQIDINKVAPVYASDYGRNSCWNDAVNGWKENFADAFLKFVVGEKLPAPLKAFMGQLR